MGSRRIGQRDQEGRRGSEEAVPGPSVFPSGEPGVSGDSWGSQEGCQGPSRPSGRNRGLPLRRRRGQVPHLAKRWDPRGFSRAVLGFSSFEGEHREPLVVPQGSPVSTGVVRGTWGLLSSHCRANRPHLGLCPETPCSSPVVTGISWLHSRFTQGVSRHLELRREPQGSSPFLTPISGYLRSWQMGVRPRLVLRHGTPLALALFVGCQATFEL